MAINSFIPCVDYANTLTLANGIGTLTNGQASGVIQLGKRRLFMLSTKDTTVPGSISQIAVTFGNSAGVTAPTPTSTSPFFSTTQVLIFDTGDAYDQIQVGNFHNASDSIDYSICLLSKF
jgi:hypothetical protein